MAQFRERRQFTIGNIFSRGIIPCGAENNQNPRRIPGLTWSRNLTPPSDVMLHLDTSYLYFQYPRRKIASWAWTIPETDGLSTAPSQGSFLATDP